MFSDSFVNLGSTRICNRQMGETGSTVLLLQRDDPRFRAGWSKAAEKGTMKRSARRGGKSA